VARPKLRWENLVVLDTPRFYYLEHDQFTDDPLNRLIERRRILAMKLKVMVGLASALLLSDPTIAQELTVAQASAEMPLDIKVQKSWYTDDSHSGAIVTASIGDDPHLWAFYCMRESSPERHACTTLEPGRYQGGFLHHWMILTLFAMNEDSQKDIRYFVVLPHDSPELAKKYHSMPFEVFSRYRSIKGKQPSGYPLLLHIYSTTSESYTIGTTPAYTSCSEGFGPELINCTTSPATNINRELNGLLASLDGSFDWSISCTTRWAASNCRALQSGLYLARWKNTSKTQVCALLVDRKNKGWELTFDTRLTPKTQTGTAKPPDR
jgi:hypothetical protein